MDKLGLVGTYKIMHYRDNVLLEEFKIKNAIHYLAKQLILSNIFSGTDVYFYKPLYISLLSSAYTSYSSDVAANYATIAASKVTALSTSVNVDICALMGAPTGTSTAEITNGTDYAEFTFNATTVVSGVFLHDNSALVFSTAGFSSNQTFNNGDTCKVQYTLQLI